MVTRGQKTLHLNVTSSIKRKKGNIQIVFSRLRQHGIRFHFQGVGEAHNEFSPGLQSSCPENRVYQFEQRQHDNGRL